MVKHFRLVEGGLYGRQRAAYCEGHTLVVPSAATLTSMFSHRSGGRADRLSKIGDVQIERISNLINSVIDNKTVACRLRTNKSTLSIVKME